MTDDRTNRTESEPLDEAVTDELRSLHAAPSLDEARARSSHDDGGQPTAETMSTDYQVLEAQRLDPLLRNLKADSEEQ